MSEGLIRRLGDALHTLSDSASRIQALEAENAKLKAKIKAMEMAQGHILVLWLSYDLAEALLDASREAIDQRAEDEHWRMRVNPETGKAEIAVPIDLIYKGMGRQ